jgi:hypothetical protein
MSMNTYTDCLHKALVCMSECFWYSFQFPFKYVYRSIIATPYYYLGILTKGDLLRNGSSRQVSDEGPDWVRAIQAIQGKAISCIVNDEQALAKRDFYTATSDR